MPSKIIIAGGTGALGTLLSNAYNKQGWEVVVLSRSGASALGNARHVQWNGRTIGDWTGELEGATAVVNLVGRSIDTHFTAKNRQEILNSRVLTTTLIGGRRVVSCILEEAGFQFDFPELSVALHNLML